MGKVASDRSLGRSEQRLPALLIISLRTFKEIIKWSVHRNEKQGNYVSHHCDSGQERHVYCFFKTDFHAYPQRGAYGGMF